MYVCEVSVQRSQFSGAPHANATSDRASVSRYHLQQDDQHHETTEQTNPTSHVRCRGNFIGKMRYDTLSIMHSNTNG